MGRSWTKHPAAVSKMQVARLECFAGISGDMLLGALIDAGAPLGPLCEAVAALGLSAEVRISKVDRSGIHSTKADVLLDGHLAERAAEASSPGVSGPVHTHADSAHGHPHDHGIGGEHAPHDDDHPAQHHKHHSHRNLAAIRAILAAAPLSEGAKALSYRAFDFLAEAEGRVHGISPDEVHFHEVGAVDAIVDIVGCAVAVDLLGLEHWYASAVNVGSGFVNCAHGRFPVPAPATAALLREAPIYSAGPEMEMATPTGAALMRALGCRFETPGALRSSAIGYGAGTRNPAGFPNVLRLTIGEAEPFAAIGQSRDFTGQSRDFTGRSRDFDDEKITVIECALDDLTPQVLAYTAQLAMERGALDVMTSPVTMKKGRMGTLLTVLSRPADARGLEELLFRETSTLGMRVREEGRLILTRETMPVQTEFGEIRMKVGSWRGEAMNVAPEFEDCRRAAEAGDVPLKRVMQAAMAEWRRNFHPTPEVTPNE